VTRTDGVPAPPDRDTAYRVLRADWTALTGVTAALDDAALVASWTARMRAMRGDVDALRSAGEWRSGARSLLAALGLQYDELTLTSALAWLLQPDGHHGLGDRLLRRFCHHAGATPTAFGPLTVQTEETRADTRADLVVRLPGATVLVEAKVRAGEQRRQCARLAELWQHEDPSLVFLTPDRRPPQEAEDSLDRWTPMSWREVADMAAASALESEKPAPGVSDLVTTLRGEH
jgi:hypothetical protein